MNQPRDPDAIIATWLDDGPIDLPDETRRAISVGLRTQPRARPMAILGGSFMNPINRLVAAAAILLAVGGLSVFVLANRAGGPGGGPSPSVSSGPSASASPLASPSIAPSPAASAVSTAGWVSFSSTRYGYTIGRPPSWTAEPAQRTWSFASDRTAVPLTSTDHFIDKSASYQIGISAWSSDLPDGTSEDSWLLSYYTNDAGAGPNCGVTINTFVPVTVDGHSGRLATSTCDDSQAFVFIGKRVYVFAVWREQQEPLLRAFLSTVTFQPVTPSPS